MSGCPGITQSDRLLSVTTFSFDISVLEIFLPLLVGAQLRIVGEELASDPVALGQLITDEASFVQATPATWRMLIEAGWKGTDDLVVLCGGEALSRSLADSLLSCAKIVWNMYGPTESTIWSSVFEVRAGNEPVSIGRPIGNTQMYILDEALQPTPIGVSGELYIGGDGLARGYLGRDALTAEKFVRNPFSEDENTRLYKTGDLCRYFADGNIEFLGRIDQQVKIRGFRIELGEIEAVLSSHEQVREVVVLAREDRPGDKRLVAYLVVEDGGPPPSSGELREFLGATLPEYMLPSTFIPLKSLPLTPNGKVDRKALPEPDWSRETFSDNYVPPRDAIEQILAEIWNEVLDVPEVGVHDNFFDLGGHSLLATQVISRVRGMFNVELPLRSLFESPTIAGQAAQVVAGRATETSVAPLIVPVDREGDLPLSFAQERLWFIDQLEEGVAKYNIPSALRLSGDLKVDALQRSLAAMIERHEALRTRFELRDRQPVQVIEPAVEFDLPMLDLSDLHQDTQPEEVQRLCDEEASLRFDLSTGPLLRAQLLRLAPREHVLLVTMHHIISDGWSIGVMVDELITLYGGYSSGELVDLPALSVQYADYPSVP